MSGCVCSIRLGVEQGEKMIGSWEKEGTLRDVQNVKTCACVTPEGVPGPVSCDGVLGRGFQSQGWRGTWVLHPLSTPSSKLACVSEGNCGPLR